MRLPVFAVSAFLPLLTSAIAIPNYNHNPSQTSTSSAAAATYTVTVGGLEGNVTGGKAILRYNPEYINGKVGDIVVFDFLANNHTVTQADFEEPCVLSDEGYDSGFNPNKANVPGTVTVKTTILDTEPAWFYCAQPGNGKPHCQAGMVFAINPPKYGDKTLEAFRSAAALVPVVATPSASPTPTSAYPSASSTTSGYTSRTTHLVNVGGRGQDGKPILKYDPETVYANTNDIVKFNFLLANHTATQSSFHDPCNGVAGGFKTGVQSNPGNVDGLIVKEFVVDNDDKPVWFYCGFATHCQQGMVFAVNPGNKFPEFKAKALKSTPRNATSNSTSTSTSTATATKTPEAKQTHRVTVGGLGPDGKPMLRYNPEKVKAKIGDIVEFNFRAANHTATQSSFNDPCTGVDGLFKTGVQMNPKDTDGLILKEFEVKDDKPAWFYCGVPNHCKQGMVFAVNPGDKFDEFKSRAMASPSKTAYSSVPVSTQTGYYDTKPTGPGGSRVV